MNKLVQRYRGYNIVQEMILIKGLYKNRILGENKRIGKYIINNGILTESKKFSTVELARDYIDKIKMKELENSAII